MSIKDKIDYLIEMNDCDERKASYCNLPTIKEIELAEYKERTRKEDTEQWKNIIFPHLVREAEYVTQRKICSKVSY